MTSSRIFLYFCLSFIGGIFTDSFVSVSQPLLLSFLVLGIFLISVFWKYKKFAVIGFCLLFLVLGIWRHQAAQSKIIYPEEQNITFTGIVVKEPDIRSDSIKLTIKSDENGSRLILVTTNRYPEYQYGDKLKISGKLKKPEIFEDFNYKDYLAKDGIYSVMYWPKVELLMREKFSFYGMILEFKDGLRESIYRNFSPPQSSILGAIILGDKSRIPSELKEKLNIAGVRHMTAVSGMHVAILTSILMTFLIGLGFWKKQAFYFTITLVVLFIIMTGLQPSAIRAGIMAGLFLLSQYLGRSNISARAIIFAAAIMLIHNPLLLRLDVGFQLSFLAMLGIIYLMPIFKTWLKSGVLVMTLSAQVFTLPILIYNFGYVSIVTPLTNILIVPILPFIMGLGFLSGISGMIFQPLSWILSWPVWLLLTYVTKLVDWFSQIPWASLAIDNLHWAWLLLAYLIFGYITWRLNATIKQWRKFQNF